MITPCAKIKYKVCLIFVFDIGIDHPLCKKMGLFDIWYFAVMYIVYLIVMIICCSVKRRRACFQNKLNMKIFLLYFIIEYENLLIVFYCISENNGSLVPDSCFFNYCYAMLLC